MMPSNKYLGDYLAHSNCPPKAAGKPAAEEYFDDYKAAEPICVRIPVRWDEHTDKKPPFAVDKAWRPHRKVVDWGLKRDLLTSPNTHHEEWIKRITPPEQREYCFRHLAADIRARFKDN
jgi:hypothetical protein